MTDAKITVGWRKRCTPLGEKHCDRMRQTGTRVRIYEVYQTGPQVTVCLQDLANLETPGRGRMTKTIFGMLF